MLVVRGVGACSNAWNNNRSKSSAEEMCTCTTAHPVRLHDPLHHDRGVQHAQRDAKLQQESIPYRSHT